MEKLPPPCSWTLPFTIIFVSDSVAAIELHISIDRAAHEDTVLARRDRQVALKRSVVHAVAGRCPSSGPLDRARREGHTPEHFAKSCRLQHGELFRRRRGVGRVCELICDEDQLVWIRALVAIPADS